MMQSVKLELEEIKSEWGVEILDTPCSGAYFVEVKKEEVRLRFTIPVGYPEEEPIFQEEDMKILEEKMRPGILQSIKAVTSANLGKPMIYVVLEKILSYTEATPLKKKEILPDSAQKMSTSRKKQKKKQKKGRPMLLACSFGLAGSNQGLQLDKLIKSPEKIPNRSHDPTEVQTKESQPLVNAVSNTVNRFEEKQEQSEVKEPEVSVQTLCHNETEPLTTSHVEEVDKSNAVQEKILTSLAETVDFSSEVENYADEASGQIPYPEIGHSTSEKREDLESKDVQTGHMDTSTDNASKCGNSETFTEISDNAGDEMPILDKMKHRSTSDDEVHGYTGTGETCAKLSSGQQLNENTESEIDNEVESNFQSIKTQEAQFMKDETVDDDSQKNLKNAEDQSIIGSQVGEHPEVNTADDHLDETFAKLDLFSDDGEAYTREVGNGKNDRKKSYCNNQGYSGRYNSHPYRDNRGRKNRGKDNYDQRRGGNEGGSFQRSGQGENYNFGNYRICGSFDEHSHTALTEMKTSLGSFLRTPFIPSSEDWHVNLMSLHLDNEADADALFDVMNSVCDDWQPCKAFFINFFCQDEEVIGNIVDNRLDQLLNKIHKARMLNRHYRFQKHFPVVIAKLVNHKGRREDLDFSHGIHSPLCINSLYLERIGSTLFDDSKLLQERFRLTGQWRQDRNFDQRASHRYPHGYDNGQSYRRLHHDVVKDRDWETQISKKLVAVLRHQAMGIKLDQEGFVNVNQLLSHQFFRNHQVTEEDVETIVRTNAKQRFCLEGKSGNFKIRANQGHTVQVADLELKEITDPSQFPTVVHGTNMNFWYSIRDTGLKRMRRNHIHMTTAIPYSGEEVISGMRNSSNCFVYIDLVKAMGDGIKFFLSKNDVILSEGIDGIIDKKYFCRASRILHRQEVDLPLGEQPSSSGVVHDAKYLEHLSRDREPDQSKRSEQCLKRSLPDGKTEKDQEHRRTYCRSHDSKHARKGARH